MAAVVATIYSDILMFLRKQDTGLTHSKYLCLIVTLSYKQTNLSYPLLWLLCIDRQGLIQIFLKEFADFLSDLLVNVDKAVRPGSIDPMTAVVSAGEGLCVLQSFLFTTQQELKMEHFSIYFVSLFHLNSIK